ncbi:MAG TPA: archaemetzincin family Zn-dependent metalloprotease [Bacteroidota bacterium]
MINVIKGIHILNASRLEDREIEPAARAVEEAFGARAVLERTSLDLDHAFDAPRGQYRSAVLLAQLLAAAPEQDVKWIAIVDVDLFIPVLTFVFGEAQLGGRAAIVSVHRLSNEFYGMPADHPRLLDRLGKEIIHELGHTAGLIHCRQFECVMRSSTYVGEIDLKAGRLCRGCRDHLADLQRAGAVRTVLS